MSSTDTTTQTQTDTKQQILSHYLYRLIRQTGGPVTISEACYSVCDVADISDSEALNLIESESAGIYKTGRSNADENIITDVSPVGMEPDVVAERFGGSSPLNEFDNLSRLPSVDAKLETVLNSLGTGTYEDLAEMEAEELATVVNRQLDSEAIDVTFDTISGLTPSERQTLQDEGIKTMRDLAQVDSDDVLEGTTSTLTTAKLNRAKNAAASKVDIYDENKAEEVIVQAAMQLPAGDKIAQQCIKRHRERKATLGHAGAIVKEVDEQEDSPGEPLAEVDPDVELTDPEAVYVSDIGHNENDPVKTGLPVLEDVGYDMVPKLASDPDAGKSALPVDENGDVIAPSVPLERHLKIPLDELIAKKLARNVPVRIIGPHGSGKNFLTKYICYKTNRGYRTLDVDKDTMPQDLFGPISPTRDGVLEPKNATVKKGLINGDTVVINEFPVMSAGAAMSMHQLLNENKLLIKSHGQEIEPHPEARILITMNPPTIEYRDSEPMNAATRSRFRSFWQGYPDTVEAEVETLYKQVNNPHQVIDRNTLEKVVEVAHRTRKEEFTNWPTLSTRSLKIVCEHIGDGATPQASLKNVIATNANPNQYPEDAFEAIGDIF